jgi:tetratricopeptide (TPR) repeat protein
MRKDAVAECRTSSVGMVSPQALDLSIQRAKALYTDGEFAASQKLFGDILRHRPQDQVTLCNRAACAYMLRDYEKAFDDCEAALLLAPHYELALLRAARAKMALGDMASAKEYALRARAASRQKLEQVRGGRMASPGSGVVLKAMENAAETARLFDNIDIVLMQEIAAAAALLNCSPHLAFQALDNPAVLDFLGETRWSLSGVVLRVKALRESKQWQEAVNLARRTLPPSLHGDSDLNGARVAPLPIAFFDLTVIGAWCAWCAEKPDVAEKMLAASFRRPEMASDATRSPVVQNEGNWTLLRAEATRLQRLIISCETSKKKANELFRAEDYQAAMSIYSALLAAAHENPVFCANILANRAACCLAMDDHEAALKNCIDAVTLNPNHTKAKMRLAQTYMHLRQLDFAIQWYSSVLLAVEHGQPGAGIGSRIDTEPGVIQAKLREAKAAKAKMEHETKLRREQERQRERERDAERRQQEQERRQRQRGYGNHSRGYGTAGDHEDDPFFHDSSDSSDGGPYYESSRQGKGTGAGQDRWGTGSNTSRHGRSMRMPSPPPADHYTVLGLAISEADDDKIRTAYLKLAKRLHPDKNPADNAADQFRAVALAYETLSDSGKKGEYDRTLWEYRRRYPHWSPVTAGAGNGGASQSDQRPAAPNAGSPFSASTNNAYHHSYTRAAQPSAQRKH